MFFLEPIKLKLIPGDSSHYEIKVRNSKKMDRRIITKDRLKKTSVSCLRIMKISELSTTLNETLSYMQIKPFTKHRRIFLIPTLYILRVK